MERRCNTMGTYRFQWRRCDCVGLRTAADIVRRNASRIYTPTRAPTSAPSSASPLQQRTRSDPRVAVSEPSSHHSPVRRRRTRSRPSISGNRDHGLEPLRLDGYMDGLGADHLHVPVAAVQRLGHGLREHRLSATGFVVHPHCGGHRLHDRGSWVTARNAVRHGHGHGIARPITITQGTSTPGTTTNAHLRTRPHRRSGARSPGAGC